MHGIFLRVLVLLGIVVLAGCADQPALPDAPASGVRPNLEAAPEDATQAPACCDPIVVVVPGPAEPCDPSLQLDNSCDGSDDGQCMSSAGGGSEFQAVSGCNDAGGGVPPPPPDGGGRPPGDTVPTCDPQIDPDCEKPLTAQDSSTINKALATMLRPASAFTDSVSRQQCAALEAAFRRALADGAVFRGRFDSNGTNHPQGGHFGYTGLDGRIHFDPWLLDEANTGNPLAIRQIAITGLHEVGHRVGFNHGEPTWDGLGRSYYTEQPFSRMNPGENSCVPH